MGIKTYQDGLGKKIKLDNMKTFLTEGTKKHRDIMVLPSGELSKHLIDLE